MKFTAGILTALLWTGAAFALTPAETRHLLGRAGFGPSPADFEALAPLDRRAAVDGLIAAARAASGNAVPLPESVVVPPPTPASETAAIAPLDREGRIARRRIQLASYRDLRSWWLTEMIVTHAPLRERMAFFWHGHFTSTLTAALMAGRMSQQIDLFRREGLGNFARLLREVATDPVMLVYLDLHRSRSTAPNENFARELFELFALGNGNYTETDIKEAARAMVGWRVDPDTGLGRFYPGGSISGDKQVLGRVVQDLDGVIAAVLEHPATAPFIVRKLWREFVSDTPDEAEVARLAALLREGNWELAPVMADLLAGDAFWAPGVRGALVKSPIDLLVGTVRSLSVPLDKPVLLSNLGAGMGQRLFDPPNVKGWTGGLDWLSSDRILARRAALQQIAKGDLTTSEVPDVPATAGYPGFTWYLGADAGRADPQRLRHELLASAPVQPLDGVGPGDRLLQALLDAAYEVK